MSTDFGEQMRTQWFAFDPAYLPLNHGSYGAYPSPVRDHQRDLQDSVEARSDPFIRYGIPKLLSQSRQLAARYLGAESDEVVFVPNATTAVNTVLHNLHWENGEVILHFSFAYPACVKTIQYICESTSAERYCIDVSFPTEDDEILDRFVEALDQVKSRGLHARLLMFDTVVTFPGVRLPWERLIQSCRDHHVLSLVDGAHGIGHIDLTHLAKIGPDFFTSNCYKWLYTPRPCAIFYVPRRNHTLIRSSLPTSHGYQPAPDHDGDSQSADANLSGVASFTDLFQWVATVDQTPYLCLASSRDFRHQICGGEDKIRQYCFTLAQRGGDLVAEKLGTEVMRNSTQSLNQCCFTNIRLPLRFGKPITDADSSDGVLDLKDGPAISKWIMEQSMTMHNTWIPGKFYSGSAWVRLSAQIYLELDDFEKATQILLDLCSRVKDGSWKTANAAVI